MQKLSPILIVCLLSFMWSSLVFGQSVYYVNINATGSNHGDSWTNAFTSLQPALDAAVDGDQIWVATGTYLPSKDMNGNTSPTDNRTKTFLLKNGVKLIGGFAGTETSLNDRTKATIADNPTILSGDFNSNDGANFTNYNDNAYHILIANGFTTATLLDGFIIRGGNATESGDLLGVSNGSKFGGGLFINNTGGHLTINNCVFTANSTSFYAGAVLINNSATYFLNCVVENNKSGFGGGMHLLESSPLFVNTVFANNEASFGGGLRNNQFSRPSFVNCTFFGNSGTTQGGAMSNINGSTATLKNCIVWGNTSPDGPAFYGGTITITYSNIQGGYTGVGNINVDPLFSAPHDLDGIDNKWMTADDGLTLREISSSANAGRNEDVPAEVLQDITGENRFQSVVNMGAYELVTPSATLFVNANATGSNSGDSWINAFTSLQPALDAAVAGDQIWVATGTYLPSKDMNGNASPADNRTKTFLLKNGVKLIGGFAGTETSLNDRTKATIADNPTILSGDFNSNDGTNFTNYNDNAYHILIANGFTTATLLDGFIIRGGNATANGDLFGIGSAAEFGGGIFIHNTGAHLSVNNCVFTANTTDVYAGAILISNSNTRFLNCVVENNRSGFGGGMHLLGSSPLFVNTVFAYNNSSYGGAMLNNTSSKPSFINCTFFGNSGSTQGGAITNFNSSSATLKNCIVWGNTSPDGPAFYGGTVTITYSNIQDGYTGVGNISIDPLFKDISDLNGADDKWMTSDDGLSFLADSHCANSGNNDYVLSIDWDIVGDIRILDNHVNMGAYENLGKTTPTITWNSPSAITYGTAIDHTQLNANSNIAGTIVYFTDGTKTTNASGAILPAGTHTLYAVINPNDAATYNPMQTIVSLEVQPVAITVTANAEEKTYGDTDPVFNYTVTSGSLVSGDEFTGSLNRTVGEDVGVYSINQNTLALNSNYILTYNSNDFTIHQRPVTVTVDAKSKQYGDADPELTYSITSGSLAGSDEFSGSLERVAGEEPGEYNIDQNSLSLSNNYSLTYIGDKLTITKRLITVKADAKSKQYGDADPELTYSITSGSLAGSDEFSGSLERVAGEEPGEYNIDQNSLSLSNNYSLTYIGDKLTITKRLITVKADAKSKQYGDADPELTYSIASGSLAGSDEFSGSLERVAGEEAGEYSIDQNTLSLNSFYDLTFVSNHLTIEKRPIIVTAIAGEKMYGEAEPELSYEITSGSLVNGDAFIGSISRAPGENAGNYTIVKNTLALTSNYDLTFVSRNFTISQRPITVTANALSKNYGEVDPALTYNITAGSLVTGDMLTGSLVRTPGEDVGVYTIQKGSVTAGDNYVITYISADLAIHKATQEITFTDLGDMELGQGPITLSGETSSGLPIIYFSSNSDVAIIDGDIMIITGKGTTVITATQPGNSNYLSAATVERTLTVKSAEPAISQSSISFGQVLVSEEASQTVTLTNNGNADLKITHVTYPQGYSGNIVNTTIVSGSNTTFEITFTPTGMQTYNGTIELTVNTPEGKLLIETTGEGITITSAENDIEKSVTLNPNPSKDIVAIKVMSSKDTPSFKVYDAAGHPVTLSFEKVETGLYTVDVKSLRAGVYMIIIHADNQTVTKRFVKL